MSGKVGFLFDGCFLGHLTGASHPETPARLAALVARVKKEKIAERLLWLKAAEASRQHLALVHDPSYIAVVERECSTGQTTLSTGDTAISADSFRVARWAAGGVLQAIDALFSGTCSKAFCAVRPPGHHASTRRGMGFCIFNNVALAARYAQKRYGVERVLIADWDVHHGNGTQEIFYADGTVLFFSTHQFPLYPGTGRPDEIGAGPARGLIINRPFLPGTGNNEIISAFRDDLLPAARAFQPQLVLVSAGFDSRRGDPLGGFNLDDEGFRELTRIMNEISRIAAAGRLLAVLEGGYDRKAWPAPLSLIWKN